MKWKRYSFTAHHANFLVGKQCLGWHLMRQLYQYEHFVRREDTVNGILPSWILL